MARAPQLRSLSGLPFLITDIMMYGFPEHTGPIRGLYGGGSGVRKACLTLVYFFRNVEVPRKYPRIAVYERGTTGESSQLNKNHMHAG